jgi:NADH-quinone oxidoreductase subunit G
VRIDSYQERIYRLKPRFNPEVNQHWICDKGRYGWRYAHAAERLTEPLARRGDGQEPIGWEQALERTGREMRRWSGTGAGAVAVLFSGHMTNEEAHLLARLARQGWQVERAAVIAPVDPAGDLVFRNGFTVQAEKAPNGRGVRQVATEEGLELLSIAALEREIDGGTVRALYCVGGGALVGDRYGIGSAALAAAEWVVVQDALESEQSRMADLVLPGCAFSEKEGCFTNHSGRIQRLRQAVPPPGRSWPDWKILQELGKNAGLEWEFDGPAAVLEALGQKGGAFAGLTHAGLDESEAPYRSGTQVYGGGWAAWLQRCAYIQVGRGRR